MHQTAASGLERAADLGGAKVAVDELFGRWGISRPDVVTYDGTRWSVQGSPGGEHLAVVSADDIWAVGRGGSFFHWDGKAWSTGKLASVWAGGVPGKLLRYPAVSAASPLPRATP